MEIDEEPLNIKVKTLSNQLYEVAINRNQKVIDLKKQIEEVVKVPIHRQRIIFRGKLLLDSETISFYKLEEGHVVQLVATTQTSISSKSQSSQFNASESSRV